MDQGDTEGSGDADMSASEDELSEAEPEPEKDDKKKKDKKEEDDKKEEPTRKTLQSQKAEASRLEELREKFREGIGACVFDDAQHRGKWFPAVVVNPKVFRDGNNRQKNLGKNEVAMKQFQNGKYVSVSLTSLTLFEDQPLNKKTLDAMSNQLRTAVDRANAFLSRGTLPNNWTAKEIFGENSPRKKEPPKPVPKTVKKDEPSEPSKKEEEAKKKKVEKKVESSSSSSESSDEEEYGEERDLFVAQLYKFQEERGTPINRAPILGGKDIDLYRFYRVVQDYGGCKRVTTNQLWKKVLRKLRLEGCPGATPVTVRKAYIRYLAHFNSFYKRLGWSLDELSITSTINSPRERRLIRPSELLNQQKQPVKRKKSTTDTKEKPAAVKKGKEKPDGGDSKEASRDPEPSITSSRERSVSSPASSANDKTKKSDKDDKLKEDKKPEMPDRKSKDEESKEKVEKTKKEKEKEKKEKEKEERTKEEKAKEEKIKQAKIKEEKEEKSKEVDDKAADKQPEKAKEKAEVKVEKPEEKPEVKAEKAKEKSEVKNEKAKEKPEVKTEKVKEKPEVKTEKAEEKPEVKAEKAIEKSEAKAEPETTASSPAIKHDQPETSKSAERYERRENERDRMGPGDRESTAERRDVDMSDEDGDGKRRKERRKSMKSEKKTGEISDSTKSSKDADEGYRPANITSRFYLGQKVRAHHHGRWYDARVVTVEQPSIKEMVEIMQMTDEEGSGLSSYAMTRLRLALNSTRCFVHYLGWNSRYDESITLNKIRLSEKDEISSFEAIKKEMGDKVPQSRLDFIVRWSNSTDGVESLTRDDVAAPSNLFSIGGYRPRRVSISQYEQLSAAAAEGLKREQCLISPSSVGGSPPLRSPLRSYEVATSSHHSHHVSSPPSATMYSKRARTMSSASSGKDTGPMVSPTPAGSTTPAPTTIYVSPNEVICPVQRIVLPPVSIEEISESFEFDSPLLLSPLHSDINHSYADKTPVKECISITCNESPAKERKRPSKATPVKEKPPVPTAEDAANEVVTADAYCFLELPARGDKSHAEVTDEHLRKTVLSVNYNGRIEEHIKEEVEVKVESESSTVPRTPTHDESDAEPSGSGTPLRTDGEDNDKWSTSDNQSAGGRMMSPGRGRGCKRKRAGYNRHSNMVVDRKYVRTKTSGKEDDSYGEEEEEEATRDTFISMKNKTYRLMEQEHSLDKFDLLGLPPFVDSSLSTDEAIEILDKRLSDLRELYHQNKADLLLMEKRRRKRAEKKRERERASREAVEK